MYYDQAKLTVRGGRGGDGSMSFRREAMVPMGGPDGGNGGRGGNIVLVVNPHLNTLLHFQHKREFIGNDGKRGANKRQTGRSGKPVYVEVPPGTVVRDSKTHAILGDLKLADQQLVVAKGGKAGRGNSSYATAHNQAPRMAENGAPGERAEIELELKLIADIGFVGMPNAGKSTLLAALTAAKPKIANYPFTTLQPNLGVSKVDSFRTVVLADIPGLIEGASEGTGLGHEFLRHIERTRVLVHLIDGLSEDPIKDYQTIQAELEAFGHGLIEKPQILAMSKMDLPDAQAAYEILNEELKIKKKELGTDSFRHSHFAVLNTLHPISSASQKGTRDLLMKAVDLLDSLPPLVEPEVVPELGMDDEKLDYVISRNDDGSYQVESEMLTRRIEITRWDLPEAIQKFQRALENSGVGPDLVKRGVQNGDLVHIGDYELEWGEG